MHLESQFSSDFTTNVFSSFSRFDRDQMTSAYFQLPLKVLERPEGQVELKNFEFLSKKFVCYHPGK
jgi:hypothetical protein